MHTFLYLDTLSYVKTKRRLTRQESREATRGRLIEAAEKAFIRHGFEASSVEAVAESAGFSRGAFYSNFRSKDDLLVEVLKVKRQEIRDALDEIIRREPDPASRLRAVLEWYVNQDLNPGWIVLETEFTLRGLRNRAARARIAEFNRQRLADYSALVAQYFTESGAAPAGRPEVIAAALFAAARGLGELALLEAEAGSQELYAASRDLVFRQLIAPGGK